MRLKGVPNATEKDLYALGDDVRAELWDGEIVAMPSPGAVHQDVATELASALRGPYQRGRGGPGGWWIIPDVDVRLVRDRRVVRPDVSGWRRERLPALPKELPVAVVPDWVAEVLSPSNHRHDRGRKLPAYAQAGVGHAWIVDPVARTVEVFARRGKHYLLVGAFGDGDALALPPFDAVTIDVSALFPGPPLAHEAPMPVYEPRRRRKAG